MSVKSKLDFEALKSNKNITVRTYWKSRLKGFMFEDCFGNNNISETGGNDSHGHYSLQANDSLLYKLNELAESDKAKHIVLISSLGILAHKYSFQSDISILTPSYAVNGETSIVPVRMQNFIDQTFIKFLGSIKDDLIHDLRHGNYPLEKIVNKDLDEIKNLPLIGMTVEGLHDNLKMASIKPGILFDFKVDKVLNLKIKYDAQKFSIDYIEKLGERYFYLLSELLANRDAFIKDIQLISNKEKYEIINVFNKTEKDYPSDKTVLDLFASQVEKYPNNIAIQFNDHQLSYYELDQKSNQVANFININYPEKGSVFGVQLERSLELIVAIFGIMKAGGVYLPLSKDHPAERINYTLKNSMAVAVFTSPDNFKDFEKDFKCLELEDTSQYSTDRCNLAKPDDIAYIIYTSGSTGKPKGVLIKHGSVVNRLNWMQNEYQLTQTDSILQKTPIVFDVSVWELFWWSMTGAKLVLAPPGAEKDPQEICEIIQREKITILHFVPSMLNALFVYLNDKKEYSLSSIRNLYTSGEELKVVDAKSFLDYCPQAQLHNLYGPTEATVDVSYHHVKRTIDYRTIPIGKPIDNTQLYIFSPDLHLQPIGVPGELLIGGVNLAVGYIGQPELTRQKFIKNPLDENTILYKTGDLARWLPDGSIEYLGRIDNQVKIRGNRIELGEIEVVIQSYQDIKGAVALAKETKSGLQLVGYVVSNSVFSEEDLRVYLGTKLPEYMIPSSFIKIEQIPVTINGKVDRNALLSLQIQSVNDYVAPETELEQKLSIIWSEVLVSDRVSTGDSFFRIGGDSILAIKLIGTINNEMSINISMVDIYENETIKKLADFISLTDSDVYTEVYTSISQEVKQFNDDYLRNNPNDFIEVVYPMSDIEKAMCFIHKSRPDDILYFEQLMQPVVYEKLDIDVMQKSLDLLVDKHEILRTGFDIENFAHIVYKKVNTNIVFLDYSMYSEEEQSRKIEEDVEKSRPEHFDLEAEKLWRIIVYKLKDSYHEILFEYHHAIIDGWSFASLLTEWNNTYASLLKNNSHKLDRLESGFEDYIVQELYHKKNQDTLDFWKKELHGHKRLKLNADSGPKVFKSVRDIYPQVLYTDLQEVAKKRSTNVKNILLSAYTYAMKMLSGESDILVGLVTFTRPLKKDGEKVLGCFLNTIPFRVKIPEAISWNDYISLIDKKVLSIKKYEHLSLFEINQIAGGGNVGNPLFDTFFNYVNWHVKEGMQLEKTAEEEVNRVEFDTFLRGNTFFDVNYDVTYDRIICMHEYSSPFMTEQTYGLYNQMFLTILAKIIESPDEIINAQEFFWNKVEKEVNDDLIRNDIDDGSNQKLIPASYLQESLWLDDSNSANTRNISLILDLEGSLDFNRLEYSLNEVISRHEILRTRIINKDDKFFQKIEQEYELKLKLVNNVELNKDLIENEIAKHFDLDASLIRSTLMKFGNEKFKLILVFHQSIVDQFSINKLTEEILTLYQSDEIRDIPKNSRLQFSDYSIWQQKSLFKKQPNSLAYWKHQLEGDLKEIELPTDAPKSSNLKYTPSEINVDFPESVVKRLCVYEQENGVEMKILLAAALKVLLHKYSQDEEILIGVSADNRERDILKDVVGPMTDIMPLRSIVESGKTFAQYVNILKDIYDEGKKHFVSYNKLLRELAGLEGPSSNPCNVLFQFDDHNHNLPKIQGINLNVNQFNCIPERHDLNISLNRLNGSIRGKLVFNLEYIKPETIQSFIGHYYKLIENLLANKDDIISSIEMLSDNEIHQLVNDFNDTKFAYPEYDNIMSVFERQVEKTPQNVALKYADTFVTYKDLNEWSDKLCSYLISSKKIKVGDLVGILLDRDEYLIPSIFGILKSGGAYVPIDSKLPADRIAAIVRDSKIKTLITRSHNLKSLDLPTDILDLDLKNNDIEKENMLTSKPKVGREDLAYVIYTSGSTGNPKGVMIEHRSLLNIIQYMDKRYPLLESDSYLLKTTYSFDVSVAEIFGWFHSGGSLSLLEAGAESDSTKILQSIERDNITHISFVPSMFFVFIEEVNKDGVDKIESLKYIFVAGESLPTELVTKFNTLGTRIALENIYGPTEATIYSCGFSTNALVDSLKVPIGKPLHNINLYVLDRSNNFQPIGVPGELCIGGEALARGYLNNEELTKEKFVQIEVLPEERIYKTGDLVRWRADGNIEYLDRIDNQVKIRGFRIELGEIENCLNTYHKIQQCAVDVKEKGGDKYLVAYYVSDDEVSSADLKDLVSSKLPEYMIPSYYIRLEKMPLTLNGKLSRNALPEPDIKFSNVYVAPSNEIEEKLEEIWSEVLKLDRNLIGISGNFFELGGHSLKAMILVNKIAKVMNITMPLEQIFERPSIKQQAVFIEINNWLDNDKTSDSEEFAEEIII
jgi:amino acid adenylation domain-containing protein